MYGAQKSRAVLALCQTRAAKSSAHSCVAPTLSAALLRLGGRRLRQVLRIHGRSVIGFAEIGQRQHQAEGLAVSIETLDVQVLPALELADQFAARLIVGHAAGGHANDIWSIHRLALVDDHPRARL